jgi:hypothetical protein
LGLKIKLRLSTVQNIFLKLRFGKLLPHAKQGILARADAMVTTTLNENN